MSSEFEEIKKKYFEKKNQYKQICLEKNQIEKEMKILKLEFQKKCLHEFVREETTSGCYREFHYICKICDYWK